jgi:hypothetical protein
MSALFSINEISGLSRLHGHGLPMIARLSLPNSEIGNLCTIHENNIMKLSFLKKKSSRRAGMQKPRIPFPCCRYIKGAKSWWLPVFMSATQLPGKLYVQAALKTNTRRPRQQQLLYYPILSKKNLQRLDVHRKPRVGYETGPMVPTNSLDATGESRKPIQKEINVAITTATRSKKRPCLGEKRFLDNAMVVQIYSLSCSPNSI